MAWAAAVGLGHAAGDLPRLQLDDLILRQAISNGR